MRMQQLVPSFSIALRAERRYPHLGRVELQSDFTDSLSAPLPSVVS
jgi:hypothetical protein